MFFLFFNHRWIRRALKGPTTRGFWGHAPPENFEILVLLNAISIVLRGQILSKMFSKSIVLFMLIFIGVTSRRSSRYILYKLCGFWNCSGYHFQLSILCVVSLYEYHKNSFENFRTTVEIWNFPIPNAYWSGFGIFEQNRKDPDEIRTIKASSQTYYFLWPHYFVFNKVKWVSFFSYIILTYFFQVFQYEISGMCS